MKNKNQLGFAVFEILFFVLLVAVLVGAAYYVGTRNNKEEDKSSSINNTKQQTKTSDPYANWQTHNGDPQKYPPGPTTDGDGVAYSFKYPSDWKFYPVNTEVTKEGSTSTTSFQFINPPNKASSDAVLNFYSRATNLDAESQFKKEVGDQTGLVGPIWKSDKTFTTKKGYSAHTAKLAGDKTDTYQTLISNKKGLVSFSYSSSDSDYFDTFQQIFDSVTIL